MIKVCTACRHEKPLTDFYGPYSSKRTGQQIWKSICKECVSERRPPPPAGPTKRELAREQRLRNYPGAKTCTSCGEEKPLADFGQPYRRELGARGVALVFNSWCLACQSKAVAARRARRAGDTA